MKGESVRKEKKEAVAERFLADLREAVEHVKAHPEEKGSMAPVYGMRRLCPCAAWSAIF